MWNNDSELIAFLARQERRKWRIVRIVADGIFITDHPMYGQQTWTKCRLKKLKGTICVMCGKPCGQFAFRPMGNSQNRQDRICTDHLLEGHGIQS